MAKKHILTWTIWKGHAIEDLALERLQSVMIGVEYELNRLLDDYLPDGTPKMPIPPTKPKGADLGLTFFERQNRFDKIKESWWHWFDLVKAEIESRGLPYKPTIWHRGY